MTAADSYRAKAAELTARAACQPHGELRAELNALAESYLRLAVQAERNSWTDVVYETPRQPQHAAQHSNKNSPRKTRPKPPQLAASFVSAVDCGGIV